MQPAPPPSTWSRQRWTAAVIVIFALQAALVLLWADRSQQVARERKISTTFHLFPGVLTERQLSRIFFAADPALFALASAEGFSGPAWMQVSQREYHFPEWNEPPQWLGPDPAGLGKISTPDPERKNLLVAEKITLPSFQDSLAPAAIPPPVSTFHLEGDLARLQPKSMPILPTLAKNEVLPPTRVEIAVDASGEVVVSRLASNSGSPEEQLALKAIQSFQFESDPRRPLTWGKVIFDWRTTPVETKPGSPPP